MLQRLIAIAMIAAAGYWYWQGPYQERINPSYETFLEQNKQRMAQCTRGKAYQLGATGSGVDGEAAKKECAEELNVYWEDGNWHSYSRARPGDS